MALLDIIKNRKRNREKGVDRVNIFSNFKWHYRSKFKPQGGRIGTELVYCILPKFYQTSHVGFYPRGVHDK